MQEISPLDGRYKTQTESLCPFFSEEALIRARVEVEIRYFIALSNEPKIKEFPKVKKAQAGALLKILDRFDAKEAQQVKKIEKKTNHDVKAVEYYLKKRVEKMTGLRRRTEFIHFGLTSEDVNNLAYGILIQEALSRVLLPEIKSVIGTLNGFAKRWKGDDLLSLTHGQPATPTTVGKEMQVFVDRLNRQNDQLKKFKMSGKFGGAVGNYSAHRAAYPNVKWEVFGHKFIKSLGLDPLTHTTQINPHDDIAELSHNLVRINTILIDASRDIWQYISRGIFSQRLIKGEVGSSTMPHKVNPIDFENAEGNLGLSSALFTHFAEKLPISRLQRDLSDSTVQRNVGVAFGYHLLALKSLAKGLGKISLNKKKLKDELDAHPEVFGEAIQMVLRKHGIAGYEKMKSLTRGEKITKEQLREFVRTLELPKSEIQRLMRMLK